MHILQDPITITRGDEKRLGQGEWLNDNLIDLRIKFLIFGVNVKEYVKAYHDRFAVDEPYCHPSLTGNRCV